MAIPKFTVENPDGNEDVIELYIGRKGVGSFNHDEHGWAGMEAAVTLFEGIAAVLGAKFQRK